MIEVTSFGGQNWLITPAARAVNEPAPTSISNQKWLLVLSGVGLVNMKGKTSGDWLRDEVHILPDMRGPLDYAINRFSIPRPPGNEDVEYNIGFQLGSVVTLRQPQLNLGPEPVGKRWVRS